MTFDEWWAKQPKDPTKPISLREAWEAAEKQEREACAIVCDVLAEDIMMSSEQDARYCAEAIRMRSNVKVRG